MTQVLNLEIPEKVYQLLLEIAKGCGQCPEEFGLQWLMVSIQHFIDDPLEPLIGSVQSNIPDWTEHNDSLPLLARYFKFIQNFHHHCFAI